MLTDATLNDIEHMARMLREATEMDAVDRALCNYIAHDLATRIEKRNLFLATADGEDVDRLTARLDAANVQLGTLRSQLAQIEADTAGDASIQQRYEVGYHFGANDDQAPAGNTDAWFMRGYKAGQTETDAVGLRQDCEELKRKLADVESALEEARTGAGDARINEAWRAGFESGRRGDPDPGPSVESWFGRGWRDATRARTIMELEKEREQLRSDIAESDQQIKRLADSNLALTKANIKVTGINANLVERVDNLENQLAAKTVETSTQNQPVAAVAILDATPAELAAVVTAHNGDGQEPAGSDSPAPRSTGFRFAGTDDELRARTIAAIKRLAAVNAGLAPTINDWDLSCRTFGLPTAAGITGRLDTTWGKLTVEAGLKPARGRR